MAKLIAQTYGQALFELAMEENKVDALLSEVKGLSEAFAQCDEFTRFMKHPQVTKEEKKDVLEKSLKGQISDDLLGFMVLIAQKGRFTEILPIFEYFIESVKKEKGIGTAYVTTPKALSDAQKAGIMDRLLKTAGFNEIEIIYAVDESLIGGMVIRIGDRIVDSSVKTRLRELTKELRDA